MINIPEWDFTIQYANNDLAWYRDIVYVCVPFKKYVDNPSLYTKFLRWVSTNIHGHQPYWVESIEYHYSWGNTGGLPDTSEGWKPWVREVKQ